MKRNSKLLKMIRNTKVIMKTTYKELEYPPSSIKISIKKYKII
jgi:hypothetical protein